MKPSEAYDIVENPDDHSAAQVKKAKEVLRKYSEVTERDRTTGISVSIMMPTPKPKRQSKGKSKTKKAEMVMGGMANGKKHMYLSNGGVVDNAGLRALKASGPGGRKAYKQITGRDA
tara:strand:+ start:285 stop:635 length:351 start_codon:yes stop_codon:yes gene_type:complete